MNYRKIDDNNYYDGSFLNGNHNKEKKHRNNDKTLICAGQIYRIFLQGNHDLHYNSKRDDTEYGNNRNEMDLFFLYDTRKEKETNFENEIEGPNQRWEHGRHNNKEKRDKWNKEQKNECKKKDGYQIIDNHLLYDMSYPHCNRIYDNNFFTQGNIPHPLENNLNACEHEWTQGFDHHHIRNIQSILAQSFQKRITINTCMFVNLPIT